jgi:DNA ligase-1
VPNNFDLFYLLDKLSNREITGHDALADVNGFILNNPGYEELIYNIFDRNLKTRTHDKIINKVFKDLIPTYDIPLAKKYEEHMKKVKFDIDAWYASRKLDGLRCNAIIDAKGEIEIRSRTGKPFHTLELVKEELRKLNLRSTVFDGEICIVREDGSEDFAAIQKEYNKKDHTIPNPRYKIFDILTLEEFQAKKGTDILSVRTTRLSETIPADNNILSIVEQTLVRDEAHLQELRDEAKELGWEGIMIRKDIPYEGKRSDKLLKCKLFIDAEYVVVAVVMGDKRVIAEDDEGETVEVTEELLSKVVIMHKGHEVGVGSGFSQDERRYYHEHPDEIIGKEITVQYFEETVDKTGKISLRFPTVKTIWKEGKRDV